MTEIEKVQKNYVRWMLGLSADFKIYSERRNENKTK